MKTMTLVLAMILSAAAFSAQLTVGDKAPDFTLKDANGTEHSLSDFAGKIVVLEWTNFGCPFVKKHYGSGNMQKLQKTYTEKGIVWLSICSSAPKKQGYFTAEEWPGELAKSGFNATALLPDPTGETGKLYGAKTTPHMFVIDKAGKLVYQGAIDDNRSWDPRTIEGAKNYVAEAVDALRAGKAVTTAETSPYGCSVKY
jgi:peroxiredoxin